MLLLFLAREREEKRKKEKKPKSRLDGWHRSLIIKTKFLKNKIIEVQQGKT